MNSKVLKKIIKALFIFLLFCIVQISTLNTYAVTETSQSTTLSGNVSITIIPYCENWTSQQAFNEINRIGTKLSLANNLSKQMYFTTVEKEESNASTNSKNVISIYTGLLKNVETEDELAFVIGHEVGHISKSHVRNNIIRNGVISAAGVAGSALSVLGSVNSSAKMIKSGVVLASSALVGKVASQKVSRNEETTSDKLSVDYMVQAGYNPLASISILNKISGNYFDFFSDHPSGKKRIKNLYKYISKKYPTYIEQGYDSTSYQRAMSLINDK